PLMPNAAIDTVRASCTWVTTRASVVPSSLGMPPWDGSSPLRGRSTTTQLPGAIPSYTASSAMMFCDTSAFDWLITRSTRTAPARRGTRAPQPDAQPAARRDPAAHRGQRDDGPRPPRARLADHAKHPDGPGVRVAARPDLPRVLRSGDRRLAVADGVVERSAR